MSEPLLGVRDLRVWFPDRDGRPGAEILRGAELRIEAGEGVALVGPSGAGKSLLARAVCGLLPEEARWSGRIEWRGRVLDAPRGPAWNALRGGGMTLMLQEPQASLNPVLTVGAQIAESWRRHRGGSRGEARAGAVRLLDEVGLPRPGRTARSYPHQLSGGMRQRALLAAALACRPQLLICDEPTTALDTTVQAGVLGVLDRIRRERDMALLFITHDRDVARLMTDRRVELADGLVAPGGDEQPGEVPSRDTAPCSDAPTVVLRAGGLGFAYGGSRRAREAAAALRGVDVQLRAGRIAGLAGESGCGKSTLARLLCGHLPLQRGTLEFAPSGGPLAAATPATRRKRQMIFQDPGGSLNPRQRVEAVLREAAGPDTGRTPRELLAEVELGPELLARFPHELSGGQKQRLALARALACSPDVLVADEITSALDGATKRRVLELLQDIVRRRGLALLLIDHDLDVLMRTCDEISVLLDGVVLEVFAPEADGAPHHPYSRHLLAARPRALDRDPRSWKALTEGVRERSDPAAPGCPWAAFCGLSKPLCEKELPSLVERGRNGFHRCPEAPL